MLPTTAFPVLTPMRTLTGGSRRAARSPFQATTHSTSFAAAATARRAWSDCGMGAIRNDGTREELLVKAAALADRLRTTA